MLQAKLKEIICVALAKATPSLSLNAEVEILTEQKEERGDFACAIAAKLAGRLGTEPVALAQAIARELNDDLLERVEVASNGFINLFVSRQALAKSVQSLLCPKELTLPEGQHEPVGDDAHRLQYASHRLSAALRQLREPRLNLLDKCLNPPLIDDSSWQKIERLYLADMRNLEPAFDDKLLGLQLASADKKLALVLDEFWLIAQRRRNDQRTLGVREYLHGLAKVLDETPVLACLVATSEPARNARIGLIVAAKRVFGACLGILN